MDASSVTQVQDCPKPLCPPTYISKNFQWSEIHDIILCREILVSEPYYFKPRSPERGKAWEKIANNLNNIHDPKFRVTTRSVRDRYTLLATKQAQKLKMEERATGIEVEQTELDVLIEEILEKEKLGKEQIELDLGEKKNKAEKEKMTAENMREQAMKRMEEKSKRKSEDTDEVGSSKMKKAKRGVGDVVGYLQEKATKEYSLKVEELEIRKKELEITAEREKAKNEQQEKLSQQQQDSMLSLVNQMQQQQQHQQNMQAMLVAQQQQQNQMLMSIMGKLAER